MKIGLLQVDGKYPNLALMKLAAWHNWQGDAVIRISPIEQGQCDKVYAAKVFTFSSGRYVIPTAIKGGTGWTENAFDAFKVLPHDAEHIYPDYELFDCDYAMGFLTRGCIRNCEFCVVPKKEGHIRHHAHLSEWWHGQKQIRLLDANIIAHRDRIDYLGELTGSGA